MKVEPLNGSLPSRTNDRHKPSVIMFATSVAAIGIVVAMCAAATMAWNERQYGAQVSSYRLQWLTALAAPGAAIASSLERVDRQLGETSALAVLAIGVSNGLVYMIGALVARLLWFVCKNRK